MKIKKYFNNHDVHKYYLFIFITQILLALIKSQLSENCEYDAENFKCKLKTGSEGDCDGVRLHLEDKNCYECPGNGVSFYTIYNNKTCEDRSSSGCPNKIIYETKECVGHCPSDFYELGDFCYSESSLVENNNLNLEKVTDTPSKACKCKFNKYNISSVAGDKKRYDCKGESEYCDSKFYNLDTGECVDKCGENDKKLEKKSEEVILETRCSSECQTGEYLYKEENQCYEDNCPEGTYKYEKTGYSECVRKCDIYKEGDNSCLDKCGGENKIIYVKINEESNEYNKKCVSNLPSEKTFYEYNEIFFEDCKQTVQLFKIKTYKVEESDPKICIENCKEKGYLLKQEECVSSCGTGTEIIYNNECLGSCDHYRMDLSVIDNNKDITTDTLDETPTNEIINLVEIKINQYPKVNECLDNCPSGTYIDEENKKCYITSCSNEKIIDLADFKCISQNSCQGKIYSEISYINIINEVEGGRLLDSPESYKITKKYCLSSCPVSAPYSDFGKKECYDSPCNNRDLYSAYDNPYDCYDSCDKIPPEKEYNYEKDYICYKGSNSVTCDNYYYKENGIIKCATMQTCIDKKFSYIKGKECVNKCDDNDYRVEKIVNNNGEIQNIGKCFSEAKECTNINYIFINSKICDTKCDLFKTSQTNPLPNDSGDTCFQDCPTNYPYKDTKNKLCLMNCEKYFYKSNGKSECMDNCKSGGKYYFEGSYQCLDNCEIGDKSYYKKKDDEDNICYYSCPDEYSFIEIISEEKVCVNKCEGDKKYYYEDKKICLENCDIYNSNSEDDYVCVNQCPQGKKVVENESTESIQKNYCDSECPREKPYTLNQTLVIDGKSLTVEQCVAECGPGYLKSSSTNYCLRNCTFSESYEYNGYCYEKCPRDTFPNDIDKRCYDISNIPCTEDFKYYEKDENGNYRCRKTCYPDKYALPEGGECLESCQNGYPYISSNKLCLKNCNKTYGELFRKIEPINNGEQKYECLFSCDEDLLLLDTNECIKENVCPLGYYKFDKICAKDCSFDDNKKFITKDNGENAICEKQCHLDEPYYYEEEKKCKNTCDEERGKIKDWDNKCVSYCTNQYYKFSQDEKCVNECDKKKFIQNNTCVDQCSSSYNYIVDGKYCKTKCDEGQYIKKLKDVEEGENIQYTLYECVENCGDFYYYESGSIYNQKKCFEKCNDDDFIIQDTHICTSVCPSTHKSYFTDKDNQNSKYPINTCVLKCPSDKPFLYLGKCVNECPTLYKYHIEGEYNCINDCPVDTNVDGNICKKYCPNEKFYDGKNCVDECLSPNKYYVKGINKCLSNCDNQYHIEDGKVCVEYCSDGKYLDGNLCIENCPNDKRFVNIYANNSCIEQCPDNYYFYEHDVNQDINFCKIKCDNVSAFNGECMPKCNSTYKYYDYKNMICLKDECQNYYLKNDDDDQYRCYEKCPDTHPYINNKECKKECNDNDIINLDTYECQDNCNNNYLYEEESGKKYCLKSCQDLGLFQYGENECLKDCSKKNLIPNMANKKCECDKYYYLDGEGKIQCITDLTNKYILYGTYQIFENCNDYLYYGDNYCYKKEDPLPLNTKIEEGNKIVCKYKGYKEGKIMICLGENDLCPSAYKYLIPDKKECVKECDNDQKDFGFYCLNKERCENKKFYFKDNTETNYECVNDCSITEIHKYLIDDLSQCVKNCSETDYYILYNNECYSTCEKLGNTIVKKSSKQTSDGSLVYFYECACTSDLWYKNDANEIICNSNDDVNSCKDLINNKPNLIKDTKECVDACPEDYKFLFNNECFYKCEDVKKYYGYDVEPKIEGSVNKCKCKNLWKSDENEKEICIDGNVCKEEGYELLVFDSNKCVGECPEGYDIIFNSTCYKENCPDKTKEIIDGEEKKCLCKNKWYKKEDKTLNNKEIIICLDENEECPKDFYPYLDFETNECLDDLSKCDESKKIFNNICYKECPLNTKPSDGSKNCECDKNKGFWNKNTNEGKIKYECGLSGCPTGKIYIDYDTNECQYACDSDKYHYLKETQDYCYSTCPENTILVDKISKECVELINFDNAKDLKTLEEKVIDNIKEIYPKTSKGGLVYNINNSTLQIYGVNKNKTENQDLIMRNNLTYIDLSNCIDKIYEKNSLSDDTDIIIVKYDIGTSNSLINQVEYKIVNSKTGEEIPLDACEDNSIVISYPLSDLLKNYEMEKKLRILEDKNSLNIREKFLKGKELYLGDNKIDSFNINNKLYTDICYPLKLNGKDVILEDRFNYLYPLFSFCESNCIYDKTDFTAERVYCHCSPKEGVNFERTFELLDNKANIDEVKKKQKGSIMKCLGKISEISKNFGFLYGLIILLVEIAMILLTIFYSYKIFLMRIKQKFDIKGKQTNNIDTENLENMNLSSERNKNDEIIKSSQRNLTGEDQVKIKAKTNMNSEEEKKKENYKYNVETNEQMNDPEVINIKKNKKNNNKKNNHEIKVEEKISSSNNYNVYNEKSSENISIKEMEDDDNIFDLIEEEQKILTIDYDLALNKNKAELLIMIVTEILDKIYLIKAIWFLTKYELFTIYFSLYLLWHMLIISFLSLFYNNSTLHKIWIKDNYPNLNFHLSFGFLSCIISFIIYKGLYILVNNEKKIKELESIAKENKDEINAKYKNMMFWHQIKLIIFYAIEFIFVFLFFLYLTAFCGVYANAKAKLVESYGIALIEVVIIKILYGLVLGILRKVSLAYKINILYRIVQFLDLYIA